MKKLLLIILIVIQNLFAIAQDHIKPIIFDGFSPLWQHLVVDSTRLDDTLYNGTKHLSNWGKYLLAGDSIGYFVYVDKSDDLQGAYIEKLDLKTGNLLWHNVFNIETSGKREYPAYVYLNDRGNLEILCFRNIQEVTDFFWVKSQFSLREYSYSSGQLLRHVYKEQIPLEEEITNFPGKTFIFPTADNKYVYCLPTTTEGKYLYTLKYFDNNANLVNIDTVSRKNKFCCYFPEPVHEVEKDLILTGRHQHKQSALKPLKKENFDTFEFVIDLYTSNFDSIVTYDLTENIPYNWSSNIGYDKAGYIIVVTQDSVYSFNTYMAISYFDMQGNLYETLDYGKNIPNKLFSAKLPNQEGLLLVNQILRDSINNKRTIIISKSDGQGNIELIKKLSFEGSRLFGINSLDILKNNTILIGLVLWVPDPDKPVGASISSIIDLVAIDGNELGLVNTQNEIAKLDEIFIYPNPATNILTLEFPSSFNGYIEIQDELGRKIKTVFVESQSKQDIDVSSLRKGLYFIKAINMKNEIGYKYKSFVIK